MLLKVTHQTDLRYSDLINESIMELRMVPRQEQDQHRLSFELAIGPATSISSYFDWLGNTVHTFSVNSFHNQIQIIATSVVETDRPRKEPERFKDSWPVPASAYDYSAYDFMHFGGPIIVDCPELHEMVKLLNPQPGASLGELALAILHLINEKFTYKKGITTAASPITDVLKTGYGVCQDFTHLMIGLARALGIPARYVSGFIHPDAQRFRGYSQTHAWCELLFPLAGWVGFDAANSCVVGGNFVKVAVGRDFHDVPPNRGVYRGKAAETIDVAVKSEQLRSIPSELAAERLQALDIPTYPTGYIIHREFANQQEHQQQQEEWVQHSQQQQQ
ncbi:MAG: transglutaminase family protein [Tepidisphaeraceae bacterium]|jgi:transglutaminase-like putative cysteine protease